jgi:hypothetical protein
VIADDQSRFLSWNLTLTIKSKTTELLPFKWFFSVWKLKK